MPEEILSTAMDGPEDISDLLPLELIRSQVIPPSPNRRESAIDWLHDFGGFSWIAYGASSLLVISHFPSPLSEHETIVGPFFQQVIDPPPCASGDDSPVVNAVAWCPVQPSEGEIAAGFGNCVWLYSPTSGGEPGAFSWKQIAGLVQSCKVEAIKWTGSGDGLVAAGIEVVFWIRKSSFWEMAWKSRTEVAQTLVSATWSIEGPVATAGHLLVHSSGINVKGLSPLSRGESTGVLVYHTDGKSGVVKVQLYHPQPVSMIQWRPSSLNRSRKDASHSWRDVLLTCCLDGTVRLWSEIDNGRVRKSSKDINDQKTAKQSFHVTAVIEINQSLKGTLGTDIFVAWAIEIGGVISKGEGDSHCLLTEGSKHDLIGNCEWLICVGPRLSLTFWAIHCLDDISPLRFPRVTLWKKQDLMDFKVENSYNSDFSYSKDRPILVKAVASRSRFFGSPVVCSLLQLLPDNSVSWSQLYSPTLNSAEGGSLSQTSKDGSLSCFAGGVLNQDGHTGNIVQLALHPYSCEIQLAVSLDSNGLLLFWSLSSISNCTLGMQMLVHPMWKLLGKLDLQELPTDVEYSCLRWAPSVLDENRFLLLGHAGGIDCFLITISRKGENIICHKILTFPFVGHSNGKGPDCIFATPLASTCGKSFFSNSFLVLGIWTKNFQALSGKVVLHSEDPSGSKCECGYDAESVAILKDCRYISSVAGRRYFATAVFGSSNFPDPQSCDQVTSFAVVPPDNFVVSIHHTLASSNGLFSNAVMYHMATGCSDGTLKLWRISHAESATPLHEIEHLTWELVGMFTAHHGPVNAISLSTCGGKIATVSTSGPKSISTLHIFESICLIGGGKFLLEDMISLDGAVVALNWFSIGNGQLLLGVCMPNELRVYFQKRSSDQIPIKSDKPDKMHNWFCIALSHTFPVSQDFLWGPMATAVLVHEKHFSVFSQCLFRANRKHQAEFHHEHSEDSTIYAGRTDENLPCTIYTEGKMCGTKESFKEEYNTQNGLGVGEIYLRKSQQQNVSDTRSETHNMLDLADRLRGSLPVYHPKALIRYLYSGNWKRAYAVLKHLVRSINSNDDSAAILKRSKPGKPCHSIPEIHLSKYFEEDISTNICSKGLEWGGDISMETSTLQFRTNVFQFVEGNSMANAPEDISTATSLKSEIIGFIGILEKSHDIAAITDVERTQILAIVDLLGEVSDSSNASPYESLDEPGRRFWVAVRFQHLCFLRKFGRSATAEESVVDSALVAWAFQSDYQDNLFRSILRTEPYWLEMRNLGVGFWFTNATQLRTRMEKLARYQYLRNKDPKDCALLYLALNRLQVLAGLFKISKDEKDKPLVGFLSRNFQEEKNKAAALKNAYVLMGRHQLELAIAFFLLGGDPSSAVTVCAKNHGDEQLALVICRLVEGYGGRLERHLISNFLLPNAIEKGDYWLSCLLEWTLGNYSQSLMNLFDTHMESSINESAALCNHATFSDPSIGQYCGILAAKNSMRNSVGDYLASVFSKMATSMAASALNRCGFPLEALECLSSSLNIEGKDHNNLLKTENDSILHSILNPFSRNSCNWLLGGVASHLESNAKLDFALQYMSKLLREHPSWPYSNLESCGELTCHEDYDTHRDELDMGDFQHNLNTGISSFEWKYSLKPVDLCNMILVYSCNKGLLFLGYQMLHGYISREHQNDRCSVDSFTLYPDLPRLLLKASKENSYLFVRYVVSCNFTSAILKLSCSRSYTFEEDSYGQFNCWEFCLKNVIYSMRTLRPLLKLYGRGFLTAGLSLRTFSILDLLEYSVYFASTWFQRNLKGLILMIHPILNTFADGQSPLEVIAGDLMKLLGQTSESMVHDASAEVVEKPPDANCNPRQLEQSELPMLLIPEDEKWHLIGACLWIHLTKFSEYQLSKFLLTERLEDESSTTGLVKLFPVHFAKLLITSLAYVSSSVTKQFAFFLRTKAVRGLPVPTLFWLEGSGQSQRRSLHNYIDQGDGSLQLTSNKDRESLFKILFEISVNPKEICEHFVKERVNCFPYISQMLSVSWNDVQKVIMAENENVVSTINRTEGKISSSTAYEGGSIFRSRALDTDGLLETRRKDSSSQRDINSFHNPKEVFKRSGELVEAICFNSINEQEIALASNRKGLLFFKWKVEEPLREQAEYIWSQSDWPRDGWAGCESTPIPTFVTPGIGLGSKKGAHLGLGGATVGLGSLARPGRDLTGGGAFGIPGYAGIGASGLGWGVQEDFEEFVDLPATVENISSRALSRHPSRPFFLVGSSNTHVYLWEFGKDRATATYGVLPAANVPPPYALASISALKFDHCGHRFATAALDGTVCTWQLEVGGRNNVHPTESSLCFNNYASDVAYVTASGSILAAAGCSTNGINVVIWDTLAPPATSQASLICHEGGAHSLSVFDNDIGSGSISPLIITGGRSGDVGLHDFRFIATGRTKRHRHSSEQDVKSSAMHDTNSGVSNKNGENVNGMIWYIPKAHLGTVTRISTIPNTSLFLTGSKDGDVKLWDAKRSELVFHWQKMHERHTFLQPHSRGFGGIVRAAVTDIQVLTHGFLTCGGDGSVKLVQLR